MNASMEDKASCEWFKEVSDQGLKPDEIHRYKSAKRQDWGYKSFSDTTKENKAAAGVMIMCKLNVLGTLWTLVYLIGLGYTSDKDKILYSLQRVKTDLDSFEGDRNWTDVDSV